MINFSQPSSPVSGGGPAPRLYDRTPHGRWLAERCGSCQERTRKADAFLLRGEVPHASLQPAGRPGTAKPAMHGDGAVTGAGLDPAVAAPATALPTIPRCTGCGHALLAHGSYGCGVLCEDDPCFTCGCERKGEAA